MYGRLHCTTSRHIVRRVSPRDSSKMETAESLVKDMRTSTFLFCECSLLSEEYNDWQHITESCVNGTMLVAPRITITDILHLIYRILMYEEYWTLQEIVSHFSSAYICALLCGPGRNVVLWNTESTLQAKIFKEHEHDPRYVYSTVMRKSWWDVIPLSM